MSLFNRGCWQKALANEREICRDMIIFMNADVEVKEKNNNGTKATLIVYPNKRVLVTNENEVTSISPVQISGFQNMLDELCPEAEENYDHTLIVSTKNNDQKVCKLTSLKPVNHNDKKALEVKVSTNEYNGKGATAKNALSLFSLSSKEDNATIILISSIPSIRELLKSNLKNFTTLSTALKAADLENDPRVQGLFEGTKKYTVFPPTNDAFSKLPDGTVTDLLKPKNKSKLRKILRNHIVAGALSAADIMKKKSIKTVDEKRLKIKVKDGKVYVGNGRVITADVPVSNGYAHVINRVLLPE